MIWLVGLILVGIAYSQGLMRGPIMSCDDAKTVLGSMSACNTTWTNVRDALLDGMNVSDADATTLCEDMCAHTVLQMVYRCASEVGVSSYSDSVTILMKHIWYIRTSSLSVAS